MATPKAVQDEPMVDNGKAVAVAVAEAMVAEAGTEAAG